MTSFFIDIQTEKVQFFLFILFFIFSISFIEYKQ